jgi:hydroxysqualene dehydroxylase
LARALSVAATPGAGVGAALPARSVAVIGSGWAGLAAAVEACSLGHSVTVFEMAAQAGGRARDLDATSGLDNGQHILIGAYSETLALMQRVGVDLESALLRTPLRMIYPDGRGLALGRGHAAAAFARAVLRRRGWSWAERIALLGAAAE